MSLEKDNFQKFTVAPTSATNKELCQAYNALLAWLDSQEISYGDALVIMSMLIGAALSESGAQFGGALKILNINIKNSFDFAQARLFDRLFERPKDA